MRVKKYKKYTCYPLGYYEDYFFDIRIKTWDTNSITYKRVIHGNVNYKINKKRKGFRSVHKVKKIMRRQN